ncbi:SEC-C metal-binding domain-containing protein [Elongatibacter sediminis]|uniref:SEC-C metal-binding domain-containing protein n=1 Tax=Elongatibacter sediminis TaxID=3119006 RepID=A0AAW9RCT6_9GAMM
MNGPGRNQPCPCGSGRKYKRCHGRPGAAPLPSRQAQPDPAQALAGARALLQQGLHDAAGQAAQQAPASPERCRLQIDIELARGANRDPARLQDVLEAWRRLQPRSPEAASKAFEVAITCDDAAARNAALARLLRLAPDHPATDYFRGLNAQLSGDLTGSLQHYACAARQQFPRYGDATIRVLAAGKAADTAIGKHPGSSRNDWSRLLAHPDVVDMLARALDGLDDAIPEDPRERGWLANAWYQLAAARRQALVDADRCRAACERALALNPEHERARTTGLFALNYDTTHTAEEIYAIHRELAAWWPRHAGDRRRSFANPAEPDRVLNIAYLSSDFRHHPVAYFILPVLREHDPGRVRTFAYHLHERHDDYTRLAQQSVHRLVAAAGLDDAALARQIEADGIDILIDLNGTSGEGRPGVLARGAAPVQITWLGSPHTTGLDSVDYRIVDARTDPLPDAQDWNSERLLHLPRLFSVYHPISEPPPVAPAPCLSNGFVTFGSFNNVAKINPPLLACWADVLKRVPDSRLLMKYPSLDHEPLQTELLALLRDQGIDPGRIEFAGRIPGRDGHLEAYSRIDIQLDTYPYHGTTTTCESLLMGVPVITRTGREHRSRVGGSLLHSAGHPEWVADDRDAFVSLAAELAADPQRLGRIRAGLRDELRASALMDAQAFTRDLEATYRSCWRLWCESGQDSSA